MANKTVFMATDPNGNVKTYDDPQDFYNEQGYNDPDSTFLVLNIRPNLWHYVDKNDREKVLFTLKETTVQVPDGIRGFGEAQA